MTVHSWFSGSLPTISPSKGLFLRKLLILIFVFALIAASCSGTGKSAATVNDVAIPLSDVEALSPDTGTIDRETFTSDLRNLVIEQVVIQAAQKDFGITLDDDAVKTRYNEIVAGIPGDLDTYLSDNSITEATLRHVAIQQVLGTTLNDRLSDTIGEITDADVQAAYDQSLQSISTVCVHHILVGTEEEANAVIDRINDGEAFEDIAKELSTDTQSGTQGGDLGCGAPSQYVPNFAFATMEAPVGEVYGPVQSEYGYHVIRVDSRETPSLDETRDQIVEQLKQQRGQQAFTDWITKALDVATITIDPQYGTWKGAPDYTITPPAA